jgi:transposase
MTTTALDKTAKSTAPQGPKPYRLIKLGVDVHWREYVVVRQIDGASPQPAQKFTPDGFVAWVAKQAKLADEVCCCYEAGPFGFVLHKWLAKLGVRNWVVRPRNWDEYGKRVKTDRRDALALVSCLDRYRAGNLEALTVVRVPTDEEERSRSETRQRTQLLEERKRLAAQGLSTARYYGHDLPEEWWRTKKFETQRQALPDFLLVLLGRWQRLLVALDEEFATLGALIESAQQQELPTGLGALTAQILDREIGDWTRFQNRRQVASYTGLVPSEHSSGERRERGSITKHGNPRVRHILVEASWRLRQFQPDYKAVRQRREAFDQAKAKNNSPARKKLTVGLARQFIVDWWRIRTNKTTPEKLGLQMSWPTCATLRGKQPRSVPAGGDQTQSKAEEAAA